VAVRILRAAAESRDSGQIMKNRKKKPTDFPAIRERGGMQGRRNVSIRHETFTRLMGGAGYGDSVDSMINRILDEKSFAEARRMRKKK